MLEYRHDHEAAMTDGPEPSPITAGRGGVS